ncbi:LysR substrate-binding domain-containing protein [Aquitalea sp. ASV15]|uniref:LysR substrate-binding domain-containing protein n=1 Tax=Aquitalea sp. ASV15 TaxID=2795104 RepID=UPI0018EA591F|nr:LysR substrate-binding domain-containing protein [Aquitalea sp. ASV15]
MKHHQLRALLAVAQHGSIRAAARAVCLSQPALTKALRELEQDLGVPLLMRSARGVQLTHFGLALQKRAQVILAEMQQAREEIHQLSGELFGKVSIGVTPLVAMKFLASAVDKFQKRMPNIQLVIHEGFLPLALPSLRDRMLDVLVGAINPAYLGSEFVFTPLLEEKIIITVRQGSPLAKKRSLAELHQACWILNSLPGNISSQVLEMYASLGLPLPARIIESQSFTAWLCLCSQSDLVSAVPASFLDMPWIRQILVEVPIQETIPPICIGIVTRRDALLTQSCDYLIDCIKWAIDTDRS